MGLCGVRPNCHMYNTALVVCLDDEVKITYVSAKIVTDMLEDAKTEIVCGLKGSYDFRSTLPDSYTKVLARQLMKQLRENWRSGEVDMALAKASTRVPLLGLVDFEKTLDAARLAEIQCDLPEEEGEDEKDENADQNYEFALLAEMHKDDHRTAVV